MYDLVTKLNIWPWEKITVKYLMLYLSTRNYPLRGYFLGVLTHTTAWDQLQGDDETLKCGFKIEYT